MRGGRPAGRPALADSGGLRLERCVLRASAEPRGSVSPNSYRNNRPSQRQRRRRGTGKDSQCRTLPNRRPELGTGTWVRSSTAVQQLFGVANRQTMIVPQCETRGCLENIEEIVRIDGVDGIFIGPYDLSAALDAPGDFSSSQFS